MPSTQFHALARRAARVLSQQAAGLAGSHVGARVSSSSATAVRRQAATSSLRFQPPQQQQHSVDSTTFVFQPPADEDLRTQPSVPAAAASSASASRLPVFQRQCSVMEVLSDTRVLRAVARMKLLGLPSQVKGPLPAPFRAADASSATPSDLAFCSDMLNKVSRSFAAVIRQLPPSLALPTCAFYLVLRALDTVEDEMDLRKFSAASAASLRGSAATATVASDPLLFKTSCLLSFDALLSADLDSSAWTTLRALNAANVGAGNDQAVLQSFERVVHVLRDHCTPAQQRVVADITKRMATGMAEYVQRGLGVDGTASGADYDRYCHIVAGLVGEGLSQLWATVPDSGLPAASLRAVTAGSGLGCLASDMGLFLQKANIVRDYTEDQVDGRAFWPKDIWARFSPPSSGGLAAFHKDPASGAGVACLNAMVNDALRLAPRCFEYLQHLAPGDSRILRFCAIPQVMALCTLAECYGNQRVFQGVVKTPRTQTARVCCEVGDMAGVLGWYAEVCDDLEGKVAMWEAQASFDKARDAPVAADTRACVAVVRATVEAFKVASSSSSAPSQQQQDPWEEDDVPANWPCGPHACSMTLA
jgi:farnesyl-diphosphate farnesyltransferase